MVDLTKNLPGVERCTEGIITGGGPSMRSHFFSILRDLKCPNVLLCDVNFYLMRMADELGYGAEFANSASLKTSVMLDFGHAASCIDPHGEGEVSTPHDKWLSWVMQFVSMPRAVFVYCKPPEHKERQLGIKDGMDAIRDHVVNVERRREASEVDAGTAIVWSAKSVSAALSVLPINVKSVTMYGQDVLTAREYGNSFLGNNLTQTTRNAYDSAAVHVAEKISWRAGHGSRISLVR